MNLFLQILDVNPGIKSPDTPKTGDIAPGLSGLTNVVDENADFGSLLSGIDLLNENPDKNFPFIQNIDNNSNINPLPDKITADLLYGLGINGILPHYGDSEKTEIKISINNDIKDILQNADVIGSLEDTPVQQTGSPQTKSTKAISLQQPQPNPEIEIQKMQSEEQSAVLRVIPTNLMEFENVKINHNAILAGNNDLTAYLMALSNKTQVEIPKTETSDILFRTNIQNEAIINQMIGNDILNQKLNQLNLRQVDLIDNNIKSSTDADTGRNLPAERIVTKPDFELPNLLRAIPIDNPIKGSAEGTITPQSQTPVTYNDESSSAAVSGRPVGTDANTTGNDNLNNSLMNNSDSGKGNGDTTAKLHVGHFAKAFDAEAISSSHSEIARVNSAPVKSGETNIRFIVPSKPLDNGGSVNRTITIKMEPEHLGTIRLTLSSVNHGLTGRMVVDNSATHALVESNIDHLFSELSDKGIKLDAFSISIGADSEYDKSTQDRKPFRMNNRGGVNRSINRLEVVNPAIAETASSRMYVNSNGVNWLA